MTHIDQFDSDRAEAEDRARFADDLARLKKNVLPLVLQVSTETPGVTVALYDKYVLGEDSHPSVHLKGKTERDGSFWNRNGEHEVWEQPKVVVIADSGLRIQYEIISWTQKPGERRTRNVLESTVTRNIFFDPAVGVDQLKQGLRSNRSPQSW